MESFDHQLIGKQLGTCVIERLIGSGGMGMVFLAHQTRPVRDVAVKVLRSGAGINSEAHQEFLARFRREANVIAQLDHINILPIYEYAEQDGLAYLVMPYLTGGGLRTLLEERGKLSPQEAFRYIEQAGSALQYAHDHNIVHRDVKPANMLFHADGRLVLVDFGIARITRDKRVSDLSDASLTAVGQFIGSVEYMAPEMVQGVKVDYRADIYELGIVLFQMLIGHVPYQGTSPLFIAAMQINEQVPSLTRLDPSISPAIDAVVQKAMAKNPASRFESVKAMVEAFRQALGMSSPLSQGLGMNTGSYAGNQSSPFNPYAQPNYPPSGPGYVLNAPDGSRPYNVNSSNPIYSPAYAPPRQPGVTPHGEISYPATAFPSNTAQGIIVYPPSNQVAGQTPPPYNTMERSQTQKRGSSVWLGWLMAVCIVVVLGVVGMLLGPQIIHSLVVAPPSTSPPTSVATSPAEIATPTLAPTPTQSPTEQAQATVKNYYDAINQQDFRTAYQQWSKQYYAQYSYEDFSAGFKKTKHDDIVITLAEPNVDGTYRIDVNVITTELDSADQTVTHTYQGNYVVGPEDGAMKLLLSSRIKQLS